MPDLASIADSVRDLEAAVDRLDDVTVDVLNELGEEDGLCVRLTAAVNALVAVLGDLQPLVPTEPVNDGDDAEEWA